MIDSFSKFLSEAQTAISSYDRHLSDMKIREKDE